MPASIHSSEVRLGIGCGSHGRGGVTQEAWRMGQGGYLPRSGWVLALTLTPNLTLVTMHLLTDLKGCMMQLFAKYSLWSLPMLK